MRLRALFGDRQCSNSVRCTSVMIAAVPWSRYSSNRTWDDSEKSGRKTEQKERPGNRRGTGKAAVLEPRPARADVAKPVFLLE